MTTVAPLLFRDVEIDGAPHQDCLLVDGRIEAVGVEARRRGVDEVDGRGGALLPGLADHHIHLFALAAALDSIDVSGSPDLSQLRDHDVGTGWLRVIGWHESQGELDRDRLDALVSRRPARVQHRSGALWVLNTAGLDAAARSGGTPPAGAERDAAGRLTGRLWRADRWLQSAADRLPSLAVVGGLLASYGVTAVSDATPELDARGLAHLIAAMRDGSLPQRVQLMSGVLPESLPERVTVGPRKVVIHDHELPDLDVLVERFGSAHGAARGVAVHCVSRVALALTVAALRDVGSGPNDRLEHCAIADEPAVAAIAELGVTVVTQPSFVARRGDDYLRDHDVTEHADLWRFGSLMRAGVAVVASSDAPYGDPDPWVTMRAARDRRAPSGSVLGAAERVGVQQTLAGMLSDVADPHLGPRRVQPGAPADVVLLKGPLSVACAEPTRELIAATVIDGRLVYGDGL